jgi:non-ribosomal peptide synthetase component F
MLEAVHRPRVEDRNGAGQPAAPLVHALFRARASLTPAAAAVEHEGRSLTFAALQARATALAAVLRAGGVGPESRVGIVLERGPDAVAAQLAVLMAGGAFLPLDPAYPDERLAWLAGDAGVAVAVTRAGLRERRPAGVDAVCVDEELEIEWNGEPFADADPAGAAYVIYTSGSTGTPKGVVVSHSALANHARAIAAAYGLGAGDRVLQFASPAFDVALEEVFPTLIAGATLVVRDERAMDSLAAFLAFAHEKALTVWNLPSPWWHELVGELERSGAGVPDALRLLVVGSEAASGRRRPR